MHRVLPLFTAWAVVVLGGALTACGPKGQAVYAVATSTTLLTSTSLQNMANGTVNQIRGMADAFRVSNSGGCPFTAWSANGQLSAPGSEGRAYETFNLGYPENWTYAANGLNGACSGGTITAAEAYFLYFDITLTVNNTSRAIRVVMGNYSVYKAGDLLVKDTDNVFKWIDTGNSDALVAVTETRPTSPHQLNGLKTFTNLSEDGSTIVLRKVPLNLSAATLTKSLTASTAKIVFDFNFTSAGITVTDGSTLTSVGKTISIPFLENMTSTPHTSVTVTITPLEARDRGSSFDPVPSVGNG